MKFSIKNFFRKCDHIRRKHLLKKSLVENFIFSAVITLNISSISSMVCRANQTTGYYAKCNAGLKWVKVETMSWFWGSQSFNENVDNIPIYWSWLAQLVNCCVCYASVIFNANLFPKFLSEKLISTNITSTRKMKLTFNQRLTLNL